MGDKICRQLVELARAFEKIGLKPVICGGFGVYLTFYRREKDLPLRTTNDIDLLLTQSQICEQAGQSAIAEIITKELNYIVRESGKYFQFKKGNQQFLDILTAEPVEGVEIEGFRAKFVKSRLHGRIMPEARFIEEDLITVKLSDIFPNNREAAGLEVSVPSLMNQLIFKLFAFRDKHKGPRRDDVQAQAHAFDIYVIITLADIRGYRAGRQFLSRHNESDIVEKAKVIVTDEFSTIYATGWQYVLRASKFYPGLNIAQKRDMVDGARRRLMKWFNIAIND